VTIDFTLVVDKDSAHAENVRIRKFESLEQEPQAARRLKLLENLDAVEPSIGHWLLANLCQISR